MDNYKNYDSHLRQCHNQSEMTELKNAAKRWPCFYERYMPLNKEAMILDLGCGLGHWIYIAKKLNYKNVWGVDKIDGNISYIKNNITSNVVKSDIFEFLSHNLEKYDLIHSKDVIEHIPQEKLAEFINSIYQSLKPGGRIIISTANAVHPLGRYAKYSDITHTMGAFTETSLKQLLMTTKFTNIEFVATSLPLKKNSLLGFLKRIIYLAPSHFLMKLYYLLEGIRPLPKVYHWHITVIATKK